MKQVLIFLVAATLAQAVSSRPDFSGTWAPDTEMTLRNLPPFGGGTGGRGSVPGGRIPMTVSQDLASLTILKEFPSGVERTIYRLDGTPTKHGDLSTKVRWEGERLVIETTLPYGPPYVLRSAMYFEGSHLVIEDSGRVGENGLVVKAYYKRAPSTTFVR